MFSREAWEPGGYDVSKQSCFELLLKVGDLVVDLLTLAHQPLNLFIGMDDCGVVTSTE